MTYQALQDALREYRIKHGTVTMVRDTLMLLRRMLSADTANLRAATVEYGQPAPYSPTRLCLLNGLSCALDDATRTVDIELRRKITEGARA
jgi:hypothetical protein